MSGALDGVRILDLTHAVAGPSATKLLADLGAEVLKIEPPGTGDFTRRLVPYCFEAMNRGKRSLTIDLKSADGVAELERLAATADVLVQSQRPGLLESRGLGRRDVARLNPRLIYASLSGFGPEGPDKDRRGIEQIIQAISGLGALQGSILGNTSFVDQTSGLVLYAAILAALLRRERTGKGDAIDVSLLDVAIYLQSAPLAEFSVTGHMHRQEGYQQRFPAVGVFEAGDAPLFLGAYSERDWEALGKVFGRPDLLDDPRFATGEARLAHVDDVQAVLREELATRTRRVWLDALEAHDVMAAPLQSYADVLEDPQVRHNGILERVRTTRGDLAVFPRSPHRFASDGTHEPRPAPALGADTAAVLESL